MISETDAVTMIDTIHDDAIHIPETCLKVAGYVTGTFDIQWTDTDWERFSHSGHVRINQSGINGLLGDVLDAETGGWTINSAVTAARERRAASRDVATYIQASRVTLLTDALNSARIRDTSLWVANWNLSRTAAIELLGAKVNGHTIVAVQYASPTSDPLMQVPGASFALTLVAANVDLSVTMPGWFAYQPAILHGLIICPPKGWTGRRATSTDDGATWDTERV